MGLSLMYQTANVILIYYQLTILLIRLPMPCNSSVNFVVIYMK